MESLSAVLAASPSALPAEQLLEILSEYEEQACVLFTDTHKGSDGELLCCFYGSYLLVLLLVDDL